MSFGRCIPSFGNFRTCNVWLEVSTYNKLSREWKFFVRQLGIWVETLAVVLKRDLLSCQAYNDCICVYWEQHGCSLELEFVRTCRTRRVDEALELYTVASWCLHWLEHVVMHLVATRNGAVTFHALMQTFSYNHYLICKFRRVDSA